MSIARRVGFATATFAAAWGAGFVMQNGDALASRFGFNKEHADLAPHAHPIRVTAMGQPIGEEFDVILGHAMESEKSLMARRPVRLGIETRDVVVTNQPDLVSEYRIALLGDWPSLAAETTVVSDASFGASDMEAPAPTRSELEPIDCTVALKAETKGAALVRLALAAPCRGDEQVTIQHEAISFTGLTSPDGNLEVTVPALVARAEFFAFFADGEGIAADAEVPEIVDFDRVAVTWSGNTGLQIHAREFGAGYGEEGHVWSGKPMTPANALMAQGGFISRLGDGVGTTPKMGEVYTFPRTAIHNTGAVELTIEAEISALNCGRRINATSLQSNGDQPATVVALDLAVPGCDAVGDLVMLDSLFTDLRIAGN